VIAAAFRVDRIVAVIDHHEGGPSFYQPPRGADRDGIAAKWAWREPFGQEPELSASRT
jgi:hypothetical protein